MKTSHSGMGGVNWNAVNYMASSLRGQGEPNPVLWLVAQAGKYGAILPARDYAMYLARK